MGKIFKTVSVYPETNARLNNYFKDVLTKDQKINKLLDIVTPRKGKFIWYLDIENIMKTDQEILNDYIMISFSKVFVEQINLLKADNNIFRHSLKAQINTTINNLDKAVSNYIKTCSPETQKSFKDLEEVLIEKFQNSLLEVREITKFADKI